jgi:GNAT superfamily N-acetyltransferase
MTHGIQLTFVDSDALPDLRIRYRQAMATQIVHDLIHTRSGWTKNVLITIEGQRAGFATIAQGGPWRTANALLEFWLTPEFTSQTLRVFQDLRAFDPFPAYEFQTIQTLSISLVWTYAETITCEKIVLRDRQTTAHRQPELRLQARTSPDSIRHAIEVRSGGGEWDLMYGDEVVGKGGVLFHYNPPFGDVYMEIGESHRNRGWGRFLIQELKRECYAFGQIPAARTSPENHASFVSLCHAGFEPSSQILVGRWKA